MADPARKVRRALRVAVAGALRAEVNGAIAASVQDLSEHGARIEHGQVVRPGHGYVLHLYIPGLPAPLRLPSRAVWSAVRRIDSGPEHALVFHSGVEFQGLVAEAGQPLAAFLAKAQVLSMEACRTGVELDHPAPAASPQQRHPAEEAAAPEGLQPSRHCPACGEQTMSYTVRSDQGLEVRCALCGLTLEVRPAQGSAAGRA